MGNKLHYLTEVRNAGTEVQDTADKKVVTSRLQCLYPSVEWEKSMDVAVSQQWTLCVCIFVLTYACIYI